MGILERLPCESDQELDTGGRSLFNCSVLHMVPRTENGFDHSRIFRVVSVLAVTSLAVKDD
jgi:hypothetical protein